MHSEKKLYSNCGNRSSPGRRIRKKVKKFTKLLETGFKKLSEEYKFFHSFSGMGALYGLEFELPEVYKQLEKIFKI